MKLSIAMAVYNGEHFIQEQLDSYARQSRLPDELVVSDNASVDSTVDIVRDFAERAPFRVGLFVNERNLGVSKNFENAIDKCTGDIIFLSDCDDVWYPDKLKVMEKAFLRWPTAAVATCNADLVDEFLRPLRRTLWQKQGHRYSNRAQELIATGRMFRIFPPGQGCCMAFKGILKDLILPLPAGDPPPVWHDVFILWTIVLSGAGRFVPVSETLQAYRQHAQQLAGARGTELSARIRRRSSKPPFGPFLERMESPIAAQFSKDPALRQAILRHWRARWHLPEDRIVRTQIVLKELVCGRYHRFSHGFAAAAKDLLFVA
jgi:glycosyltransferase involved in cell wall biosynthesis